MKVFLTVISFLLSRYRWFWRIKGFLATTTLRFRNLIYQFGRNLSTKKRLLLHLIEIARLGLNDIFLVSVIVGAIYILPLFLFGIDFRDVRNIEAAYVEILSVVAGVCGVIIGLYYAAILSLGSSTYSKMPPEAKELLRKEPIGSVFVWYLSFLTFFSITLLALYYFNFEDSFFGIQLVLLGSGLAIFGLTKLGYRLFYFTDPTILANSALDLLRESFELATAGKFSSIHPAFQQHYNKQANISLNTYELLAKVAKTEEHLQTESYLGLCESGLFVLRRYLKLKSTIPYNSKFFQIKIKHKKWYESGDLSLDMYEKIGHLPADEIKDHNYIENKILEIVYDCIELNIINGNYDIAERAISGVSNLTKLFSLNHNSQLLIDFCRKIEEVIFNNAPEENKFKNSINYDSYLRVIDGLGYLKSNILIEFYKTLDVLNCDSLKETLKNLPWGKEAKLFEHGFPISTHEMLLFLNKTIQFEIFTQGKRISPDWYVANLLFLKYTEGLFGLYQEIFKFTEEQLDSINKSKLFKRSTNDKWANLYMCCYLDRILEHYQKLNLINNRFKEIYEMLHTFSKIEGLTWPDYKEDHFADRLSKFSRSLTEAISKSGAIFNIYKFPSEYPDYGGKFLHFSGNSILQQLIEHQTLDKNTFSMFHTGSLVMFDKLGADLRKIGNLPVNNQLHFMVAPIIDLVTLSGLIIIIARYLKNDEYEKIVRACWDEHLKTNPDEMLKKLAAILEYPEGVFMSLPHRHSQRFNWHRDVFNYLIENLEIKEEWYTPKYAIGSQERHIVSHDSAMVRYLVSRRCGRWAGIEKDEGLNIFVDFYLLPKATELNIQNLKFSRDQGELAKKIFEEDKKQEDANEQDENE